MTGCTAICNFITMSDDMMENIKILAAIRTVLNTEDGKRLIKDLGADKEQLENFMFAYYMCRSVDSKCLS